MALHFPRPAAGPGRRWATLGDVGPGGPLPVPPGPTWIYTGPGPGGIRAPAGTCKKRGAGRFTSSVWYGILYYTIPRFFCDILYYTIQGSRPALENTRRGLDTYKPAARRIIPDGLVFLPARTTPGKADPRRPCRRCYVRQTKRIRCGNSLYNCCSAAPDLHRSGKYRLVFRRPVICYRYL